MDHKEIEHRILEAENDVSYAETDRSEWPRETLYMASIANSLVAIARMMQDGIDVTTWQHSMDY